MVMVDDVGALRRAAALLTTLAEAPEPLGASEAARRSGVARNTAFRTLKTLAAMGWVVAVGDQQRYRLSGEPARLFGSPWQHSGLSVAAHPPLRRLAAAIGETVYVAVRDGQQSVNVQVIEGRGLLRISGALGQGFPLHASAPGKVFLAFEPGLLDQTARRRLAKLSDATIIEPERLRREIRRVRVQGFALNREELARGLVGLAVPILDASVACVAALGILVPVSSCRAAELAERYAEPVLAAASAISRALGRR
jgi:DNA-binding IclR family transcriptional regulator